MAAAGDVAVAAGIFSLQRLEISINAPLTKFTAIFKLHEKARILSKYAKNG
jgi:hypothetical protein